MGKRKSGNHTIDIIFPLLFIFIFCICVTIFILAGTNVYRTTVAGLKENYTLRTAVPYIQEKCRECANPDQIEILENNNSPVLAINKRMNQADYVTYIYQKDGYLRELYTKKTENPPYDAGQKLLELTEFQVAWEENGLLVLTLTADQKTEIMYLSTGK